MKIQKISYTVRKVFEIFKNTEVCRVQINFCVYSCAHYGLNTLYSDTSANE